MFPFLFAKFRAEKKQYVLNERHSLNMPVPFAPQFIPLYLERRFVFGSRSQLMGRRIVFSIVFLQYWSLLGDTREGQTGRVCRPVAIARFLHAYWMRYIVLISTLHDARSQTSVVHLTQKSRWPWWNSNKGSAQCIASVWNGAFMPGFHWQSNYRKLNIGGKRHLLRQKENIYLKTKYLKLIGNQDRVATFEPR